MCEHHARGQTGWTWSFGKAPSPIAMTQISSIDSPNSESMNVKTSIDMQSVSGAKRQTAQRQRRDGLADLVHCPPSRDWRKSSSNLLVVVGLCDFRHSGSKDSRPYLVHRYAKLAESGGEKFRYRGQCLLRDAVLRSVGSDQKCVAEEILMIERACPPTSALPTKRRASRCGRKNVPRIRSREIPYSAKVDPARIRLDLKSDGSIRSCHDREVCHAGRRKA
ncbi:hypothetical protein QFZ94_008035 [Paraburkholderia sp. JPY465]